MDGLSLHIISEGESSYATRLIHVLRVVREGISGAVVPYLSRHSPVQLANIPEGWMGWVDAVVAVPGRPQEFYVFFGGPLLSSQP